MGSIHLTHRFRASIDRVWARIDDHVGMRDWTGAPVSVKGDGGVGTVRKIGRGLTFEETILEREPPKKLVYSITRGLPVDHRGEMTLTEAGSGTRLDWHIRMNSRVPLLAPTILAVLKPALTSGLAKLERLLDG
jgi:uncharacterized protein YndB with AHSA1/START domain